MLYVLMKNFLSYNLILPKYLRFVKKKGSLNPKMRAREGGASIFTAFLYSLSDPPPASPKKIKGEAQAGGQKEKGVWGKEFCPPALPCGGAAGLDMSRAKRAATFLCSAILIK